MAGGIGLWAEIEGAVAGFRIFGCLIDWIVVIARLTVGEFALVGLVAFEFDIAAFVELELVAFAEQGLAAVLLSVANLIPLVLLIRLDLPNYCTLLTFSSTNLQQTCQTYSLPWPHLPTPSTSPTNPSKNQPQH